MKGAAISSARRARPWARCAAVAVAAAAATASVAPALVDAAGGRAREHVVASSGASGPSKQQGVDATSHAGAAAESDHPQFVMLSLDDALHASNAALAERVANVRWTFFVSVMNQQAGWYYDRSLINTDCVTSDGQDTNNDGCLSKADVVRDMYAKGHEMALHTYTHLAVASGEDIPNDDQVIMYEITRNVDYLVACGVARENITGFRAPFLDTMSWGPGQVQDTKNAALQMLQVAFNKHGIMYDSTFTMRPDACEPRRGVRHCSATEGGWGYHACGFAERSSYGWAPSSGGYPNFTSASDPSPTWHLFMNAYTWQGTQMSSMDQANLVCKLMSESGSTCTASTVKELYLENFLKHYYGSRHPFGVFLHGGSLISEAEVEGLNAFLDEVRRMPGVVLATQGEVAAYYHTRFNASSSA